VFGSPDSRRSKMRSAVSDCRKVSPDRSFFHADISSFCLDRGCAERSPMFHYGAAVRSRNSQ